MQNCENIIQNVVGCSKYVSKVNLSEYPASLLVVYIPYQARQLTLFTKIVAIPLNMKPHPFTASQDHVIVTDSKQTWRLPAAECSYSLFCRFLWRFSRQVSVLRGYRCLWRSSPGCCGSRCGPFGTGTPRRSGGCACWCWGTSVAALGCSITPCHSANTDTGLPFWDTWVKTDTRHIIMCIFLHNISTHLLEIFI